jgi:hypothetical protein
MFLNFRQTKPYLRFLVMQSLKAELDEARNRIRKLDAEYIEELKNNVARLEAGRKRMLEDGKAWEDVLKTSSIDLTKFVEHDKADAQKAEQMAKEGENRLKIVPKEVLSRIQDQLRIDEALNSKMAYDPGDNRRRWFLWSIPYQTENHVSLGETGGAAVGDCGLSLINPNSSEIHPIADAKGAGAGFNDSNSAHTSCWFWYYLSGDLITTPGTITVWPYFDIHGFYQVRANDGFFTSKEADVALTLTTRLHKYDYTADQVGTWVYLNKGKDNINEENRIDFTGYGNAAKATAHMLTGEPLLVQVIVNLKTNAKGGGSHARLDFTGEGNTVRIQNILALVP